MEESRTQKLQQLLRRLGQAVQGSVVQSKEVKACLDELHESGWKAVMLLEASLVCRENGTVAVEDGAVRIHVDPSQASARYRLDASDAAFLSSLGISPTRHRSQPSVRTVDSDPRLSD